MTNEEIQDMSTDRFESDQLADAIIFGGQTQSLFWENELLPPLQFDDGSDKLVCDVAKVLEGDDDPSSEIYLRILDAIGIDFRKEFSQRLQLQVCALVEAAKLQNAYWIAKGKDQIQGETKTKAVSNSAEETTVALAQKDPGRVLHRLKMLEDLARELPSYGWIYVVRRLTDRQISEFTKEYFPSSEMHWREFRKDAICIVEV